MTRPLLNRRLDGLGNSIFGVMSARAVATGSINLELIRENWSDLIRLAGSLKLGHLKASQASCAPCR